jgi:hypothetical protein
MPGGVFILFAGKMESSPVSDGRQEPLDPRTDRVVGSGC